MRGYFDAGELPRQLGLDILVQPRAAGPFRLGRGVSLHGMDGTRPGAVSITAPTRARRRMWRR